MTGRRGHTAVVILGLFALAGCETSTSAGGVSATEVATTTSSTIPAIVPLPTTATSSTTSSTSTSTTTTTIAPPVPLDEISLERYARTGWVDLRLPNFELWRGRISRLSDSKPDIVAHGSAAFDLGKYSSDRFIPGEVVGWLLTNEIDEQGLVGHRLF